MRGFRVGDRVDSTRGPGDDPKRPVRLANGASVADLEAYGVRDGRLVFPGTVVELKVDGSYVVEYDCGGSGIELVEDLNARMRMPWHPRELEGVLAITMRRNIAHGRVIEGIQVRWGLVSRLLAALMRVGTWRSGEPPGPMHKHYDPRLFDVLDEEAVRMQYAPRDALGAVHDACSAEQLLACGFKVQFVGEGGRDDGGGAGEGLEGHEKLVDECTFAGWLEFAACPLGNVVAQWWMRQASAAEGELVVLKVNEEDCAADLFRRIVERLQEAGCIEDAGEGLPMKALVEWLLENVGEAFSVEGNRDVVMLCDEVLLDLSVVEHWRGGVADAATGCMEGGGYMDVEEQLREAAGNVVFGWPSRDAEPVFLRTPGRFVRCFPLEFPMGVADLFDARPRKVSVEEYVQHLLRYRGGQFVNG